MRYVSYTRTTSCFEFEEIPQGAIGIQNDHIKQYAKKHGFFIEEKYSDRKQSYDENAGFERLLEDGMMRKFDCVVVDSIFRCGRNLWVAKEVLLQTFQYAGIYFIVIEDDFDSREQGNLKAEEYFDKKYSEYRSKVFKNMNEEKHRISFRKWTDVKYGYCIAEDGTIQPDPETAEIVREIFSLFLSGKTQKEIADILCERKIETPVCKRKQKTNHQNIYKWKAETVRRILLRTAYTGHCERTVKGETIQFEIPSLISEKDFNSVKQIIPAHRKEIKNHVKSVLAKYMYDKKTQCRLNCRRKGSTEGIFTLVGPEFGYSLKDDNTLSFVEAEQKVIAALNEEKYLAEKIKKNLEQGKGKEYLQLQIECLGAEMKEYFMKVAEREEKEMEDFREFQKGIISEDTYINRRMELQVQLLADEQFFTKCTRSKEKLEIAFSPKNPWINLMLLWKVGEKLTNQNAQKFISRIWVDDFQTVQVITKQDEWKNLLPDDWMEEITDGKEK